jgi:hypothetical protein
MLAASGCSSLDTRYALAAQLFSESYRPAATNALSERSIIIARRSHGCAPPGGASRFAGHAGGEAGGVVAV